MDYVGTENKHNEEETDTIIILSTDMDSFKVYQSNEIFLLMDANFRSTQIRVKQKIHTQMSKAEVQKILDLDTKLPEVVRLKGGEIPEWIDLIFDGSQLDQIRYEGYID